MDLDIKVMKEKIKEAFKRITFNLVFAWVNLALFGFIISKVWPIVDFSILVFILPFLLIAIQSFELHEKNEKIKEICELKDLIRTIAGGLAYNLKRYRELYGELPKETPESEKQNSENP